VQLYFTIKAVWKAPSFRRIFRSLRKRSWNSLWSPSGCWWPVVSCMQPACSA